MGRIRDALWVNGGAVKLKVQYGRVRVAPWVKKWNTEVHTATAAPQVLSWILVPYFGSRAPDPFLNLKNAFQLLAR